MQKTASEELFEGFLKRNNLLYEKIETQECRTPDYFVEVGKDKIIFEIKEWVESKNFGPSGHHGVPGTDIKDLINSSKRQIQWGAKQGIPSILLIYNRVDPVLQWFGTSDMDFQAAMYGQLTLIYGGNIGKISGPFNGRHDEFQPTKNTSFSALARLRDNNDNQCVTLFENIFAGVKIPYDNLPSCFEVKRFIMAGE